MSNSYDEYDHRENWGQEELNKPKQEKKVTNHVKGIVTKIFKGQPKNDETYGVSATLKLTIDDKFQYDLYYSYGKPDNLKPEPVKVGDEVEFDWIEDDKYGTNRILHKKDNYTLKNLTDPNAIPAPKAFSGNSFKADPAKALRDSYQNMLTEVVKVFMFNRPGTQVTPADFDQSIFPMTEKILHRIYAFKLPEPANGAHVPKEENSQASQGF